MFSKRKCTFLKKKTLYLSFIKKITQYLMYAVFPTSHVKNWNLEQLFSLIPFVNKYNMNDVTTKEQYSWYVLVIAFMIR